MGWSFHWLVCYVSFFQFNLVYIQFNVEAYVVGMKQKGVQFNLVYIQLNVEACVVGMKQKGLQMKEIYSAELQSYS